MKLLTRPPTKKWCTEALLVNTVQAFLIKFPHGQWSYEVLELYLVTKHNTTILKKWGLSRVIIVYYTGCLKKNRVLANMDIIQQNYTGQETTPCWNILFWSFLSKTKQV